MVKYFKFIYYIFLFIIKTAQLRCFIFSVIIPIYNTGRYLDEAIFSLINQTIGFKNIQLILVNDGSIDQTEEISLKYKKAYPKNIIYIKIEHGGKSKAKNIGLDYATGKYITFLDPDDKWDSKAFNYILLFFKNNKNIELVAARLKFFELLEAYHPLDYKFYKTRIVNLTEDYNCIHLSASSSIFKASLIKGKKFENDLSSYEDVRLINSILLVKPIMGLIREAIYYYRKRADFTSTTQIQKTKIKFYSYTLEKVHQYLLDCSKIRYNLTLPFIQFFVGYDVLFRIPSKVYKYFDKNMLYKYYEIIERLLNQINDKYILEQKILSYKIKMFALSKKYRRDLRYDAIFKNESLIYSNHTLIDFKNNKNLIVWRILEIKDGILHLEGKDNFWMPRDKFFYFCKFGNKTFFPKHYYYSGYDFITIYGIIEKGRIVQFDIPLEKHNIQIFKFYISYDDKIIEIFPSLGWFTHIPDTDDGYYISDNYITKYINKSLTIFINKKDLAKLFENQYCTQLQKKGKNFIIKLRKKNIKYRNKINKKEIWIISDRPDKARDNGEYFFRYLKNKNPNGIISYFVIRKNCSDYKRLKPLGNVLDLNSDKYLEIFLKADKIISSISNSWVDNPFGEDRKYIRDLFHFDLIFLQHGIIKDDLSNYLNRLGKNYSLFITSTKKEYKSILNYKYGYDKKNVILTGLPRYDNLYRLSKIKKREKKILIAPTWRMNIKGTTNTITYESVYSETFKLTDYFNFYNNLINDEKLIYIMKKYNYTGIFCLHPSFSAQYIDFKKNGLFSVKRKCNYQKNILKASLLVTDYSSIFFDFAFLRKPVIYAHFDYEEYRMNHYQKGYFDYEKDGFGSIAHDLKSTVDKIIKEIRNNCLLRKKYFKRINKFFTYFDDHNNDRLYMEIINNKKLGEKSRKPIIILYMIMILINVKLIIANKNIIIKHLY